MTLEWDAQTNGAIAWLLARDDRADGQYRAEVWPGEVVQANGWAVFAGFRARVDIVFVGTMGGKLVLMSEHFSRQEAMRACEEAIERADGLRTLRQQVGAIPDVSRATIERSIIVESTPEVCGDVEPFVRVVVCRDCGRLRQHDKPHAYRGVTQQREKQAKKDARAADERAAIMIREAEAKAEAAERMVGKWKAMAERLQNRLDRMRRWIIQTRAGMDKNMGEFDLAIADDDLMAAHGSGS